MPTDQLAWLSIENDARKIAKLRQCLFQHVEFFVRDATRVLRVSFEMTKRGASLFHTNLLTRYWIQRLHRAAWLLKWASFGWGQAHLLRACDFLCFSPSLFQAMSPETFPEHPRDWAAASLILWFRRHFLIVQSWFQYMLSFSQMKIQRHCVFFDVSSGAYSQGLRSSRTNAQ